MWRSLTFRPTGPDVGGGHGRGVDWLADWLASLQQSLFLFFCLGGPAWAGWAREKGCLCICLSVEVLKPKSLLKLSPRTWGPKNYSRSQSHIFISWGVEEGEVCYRPGPACGVGEGEVWYKQTRPGTVSETNIHRPRCAGWRGLTRCIMHRVHTSIKEVEISYQLVWLMRLSLSVQTNYSSQNLGFWKLFEFPEAEIT